MGRPFPHISNLSKNFAIVLQKSGDEKAPLQFARLKIPDTLPRFVEMKALRKLVARLEPRAGDESVDQLSRKFSRGGDSQTRLQPTVR